MVESTKESDLKTRIDTGRASVTDKKTALLLRLLCFSATKLWNTAMWPIKEVLDTIGKIPIYYVLIPPSEAPRSKLRGIYKKEDDYLMKNLRFLKLFPLCGKLQGISI